MQQEQQAGTGAAQTPPETPQPSPQPQQPQTEKPNVFVRGKGKRNIEFSFTLNRIFPDVAFKFCLRTMLSKEAEEQRQKYLSLSALEQTYKEAEETLDELCDLMTKLPEGFGDLKDTGKSPGYSFRNYYETSDSEDKENLDLILRAAYGLYWGSLSPREFRKQV